MNYREYLAKTVQGLSYLTNRWGSRFVGTIGTFADAIAEGGRQAFLARLPGHEEQAEDSLIQTASDRDFWRFRGESKSALGARVRNAWTAYEQAGTPQQVLRAIDEWGNARFPDTWIDNTVTLVESSDPSVFEFTVTIPVGLIDPIDVYRYGDPGLVYGQAGVVYGYDTDGNVIDLYRLIKQWKPARSKGFLKIETETDVFTTLVVA